MHSMEPAKIGPNSIIQTVEALKETYGIPRTVEILHQGDHDGLMDNLPTQMVDEKDVMRLFTALVEQLGSEQTMTLLKRSGQLTAFYLLQHRIPRPFQKFLRFVPRSIAFTLLMIAISKSAWTFVGSGVFSFTGGKEPKIIISNRAPVPDICPEVCSFYAGTFEKIFQVLIDPQAKVEKIDSGTNSELRCVFNVFYRKKP